MPSGNLIPCGLKSGSGTPGGVRDGRLINGNWPEAAMQKRRVSYRQRPVLYGLAKVAFLGKGVRRAPQAPPGKFPPKKVLPGWRALFIINLGSLIAQGENAPGGRLLPEKFFKDGNYGCGRKKASLRN
jgi:hypothetical protein